MADQLKLVHEQGRRLLLALKELHVARNGGCEPDRLSTLNHEVIRAVVGLERAVNPQRLKGWGELIYPLSAALDPSHLSGVEGQVRWLSNWTEAWFPRVEFFGSEEAPPEASV